MRRVFTAAFASLMLWSQAAVCLAQSPTARASEPDADALAAAARLAGGLEPDSTKDALLTQVSESYAKAGRFDEAERAASSMDDGGPKALALVQLAGTLADAGKLDRAAGLLEESVLTIRRAGEEGFDWASACALSTIVRGGQRWDFDAATLTRVPVKGALARLVEAGRAEEAANILSAVKSAALDFELDDEEQVKLFAGAARLYASAGDTAKAGEALADASAAARRVEGEEEITHALCELAGAYLAVGDRERAGLTLTEAAQTAWPLKENRDRTLRRVADAYASAGLYERAREAAGALSDDEGARTFALLAALGPETEPADLEAALSAAVDAAVSLEEDWRRSQVFEGLASTYGARAPGLLARLDAVAPSLRGARSRAEVLTFVGDAHSGAGRKEDALEVWRRALASARALRLERVDLHAGDSRINDREKLDLLFALARRFARAGSHELAREIARDVGEVRAQALRLAEGHPAYPSETGARLAELAVVLLRAGHRADALEVLEDASRATSKGGSKVDEYGSLNALGAVAAAYAKAGERSLAEQHFRRAFEAAQKIELNSGLDALCILSNIGGHYAEAGMKPDAVSLKAMRRLVRRAEKELD